MRTWHWPEHWVTSQQTQKRVKSNALTWRAGLANYGVLFFMVWHPTWQVAIQTFRINLWRKNRLSLLSWSLDPVQRFKSITTKNACMRTTGNSESIVWTEAREWWCSKGCSLKVGLMWMQKKKEGIAKQLLREEGAALCRAEALIITHHLLG